MNDADLLSIPGLEHHRRTVVGDALADNRDDKVSVSGFLHHGGVDPGVKSRLGWNIGGR